MICISKTFRMILGSAQIAKLSENVFLIHRDLILTNFLPTIVANFLISPFSYAYWLT